MNDNTDMPVILHAPQCQRRGVPVFRADWRGHAELFCPSCGRSCPADDQREKEVNR